MIHTTVRLIQKRRQCQEWDSNPRLQGRLRPERSALDRSAILTCCGMIALKFYFSVYMNDKSPFFPFFSFSENAEIFQLKKATTSLRTALTPTPSGNAESSVGLRGPLGSVFSMNADSITGCSRLGGARLGSQE